MVYEWLCGAQPFQGNLAEVALQHTMMPPPSIRQKGVEIPPEVEQVVMIALAKDPEQRFASVKAFAHALEQACLPTPSPVIAPLATPPDDQATPVVTLSASLRPPRTPTIFPGRLSRRTVLVGGIGLAGLVVVGGGFAGVELTSKPPLRGTLFHTFPQDYIVHALAWSPDGTHLASADENKEVKIWDTASGAYVLTYSGHSNAGTIYTVAWSPDGKRIASGGDDNTVQVWDATTGTRNLIYSRHTGSVYAVAWSPDGTRIASGSYDGTVQVWDVTTGRRIFIYNGHSPSAVNAVAWSPDSTRIASGSDDQTVLVWDATTGRHLFIYKNHSSYVLAVAWSPDGTRIASGSADKTVQVWSPSASGTLNYSGHTDSVQAVAWSSDGQHLASGSVDTTVRVWDLSPNGNPYIYRGHTDVVYTVAWSPGGFPWPWSHEAQRLASGGKDTIVRLWQAI